MPVVPIDAANSTAHHYYLISFDDKGREIDESTGVAASRRSGQPPTLMSDTVLAAITAAATSDEPITDVVIMSHGWLTTLPQAQASYDAWIAAVEQTRPATVGATEPFRPLVVAIHWPSKPATLSANAPVTKVPFEGPPRAAAPPDASSPAAAPPAGAPPAAATLEATTDAAAPSAANPSDTTAPDTTAQATTAPPDENPPRKRHAGPIAFLYSVVPFFSFYQMKARAEKIGADAVAPLIGSLQERQPGVRVHVMGHSFGAKVVAESIQQRPTSTVKPISSMFLVEGAFSTWAFAGKEANPYGTTDDGSVASVFKLPMVTGVSVAGTSCYDYALHRMFPGAEAIDMTVKRLRHVPWRFPSLHQPPNVSLVGAIGAWGFAGFDGRQQVHTMLTSANGGLTQTYGFQPGGIYHLVTDNVVNLTSPAPSGKTLALNNPFVGAHSNIAHPELARAWWEAVIASR
jgi:hypothetical protein